MRFWRRRHGPAGSWHPPAGRDSHHCMPPWRMPDKVPDGLIFRCSVCGDEWTWRREFRR